MCPQVRRKAIECCSADSELFQLSHKAELRFERKLVPSSKTQPWPKRHARRFVLLTQAANWWRKGSKTVFLKRRVFRDVILENRFDIDLDRCNGKQLDEVLGHFYVSLRTKDGAVYKKSNKVLDGV